MVPSLPLEETVFDEDLLAAVQIHIITNSLSWLWKPMVEDIEEAKSCIMENDIKMFMYLYLYRKEE